MNVYFEPCGHVKKEYWSVYIAQDVGEKGCELDH